MKKKTERRVNEKHEKNKKIMMWTDAEKETHRRKLIWLS